MGAGGRAFKSPHPDHREAAGYRMPRKTSNSEPEPRAGLPDRSADGVDLTLIRWMLSLTPAERLRAGQEFANSITRLRARRIKA